MNSETQTSNQAITIEFIQANIGKDVSWYCYGYHGNNPYKGVARFTGIEVDKRGRLVPIVETVKGCDLHYAWFEGNELNYTDTDRVVRIGEPFDIYVASWEVPSHGFMFATGNPMQSSFPVYKGQNAHDIAKQHTTAVSFKLEKAY